MRPLFAINLAAGLTFAFALAFVVSQIYGAVLCSRAIERFKLDAQELEKWQRDYESCEGGAVRSGLVAIMQLPILIYARKLKRQMLPEPGASANAG